MRGVLKFQGAFYNYSVLQMKIYSRRQWGKCHAWTGMKEGWNKTMLYVSTRNHKEQATASQAILKGLADDGGLFVPEELPALDVPVEQLAFIS